MHYNLCHTVAFIASSKDWNSLNVDCTNTMHNAVTRVNPASNRIVYRQTENASINISQTTYTDKGKVVPYLLPSVGPGANPGVQACRWLLKSSPAVGCHYFLPSLRSPSQPKNVTVLQPVSSYTALWQMQVGVNNLPKVVTRLCPSAKLYTKV